jgi:hypothetical protein
LGLWGLWANGGGGATDAESHAPSGLKRSKGTLNSAKQNSEAPLIGRVATHPKHLARASAASSRYFTRTSRRLGTLHHTSGDSPSRPCKDAADSRNPEMDLPCIASFCPRITIRPVLASAALCSSDTTGRSTRCPAK